MIFVLGNKLYTNHKSSYFLNLTIFNKHDMKTKKNIDVARYMKLNMFYCWRGNAITLSCFCFDKPKWSWHWVFLCIIVTSFAHLQMYYYIFLVHKSKVQLSTISISFKVVINVQESPLREHLNFFLWEYSHSLLTKWNAWHKNIASLTYVRLPNE